MQLGADTSPVGVTWSRRRAGCSVKWISQRILSRCARTCILNPQTCPHGIRGGGSSRCAELIQTHGSACGPGTVFMFRDTKIYRITQHHKAQYTSACDTTLTCTLSTILHRILVLLLHTKKSIGIYDGIIVTHITYLYKVKSVKITLVSGSSREGCIL